MMSDFGQAMILPRRHSSPRLPLRGRTSVPHSISLKWFDWDQSIFRLILELWPGYMLNFEKKHVDPTLSDLAQSVIQDHYLFEVANVSL